MSNEFSFELEDASIDEDSFVEEKRGYPAITWHGMVSGSETTSGFWAIEEKNTQHLGSPEPFWIPKELRFGRDPNTPTVEALVTTCLRCCPVAVRKRFIITDQYKREYYYPYYTPRDARISGKFNTHWQVMVMIPGFTGPVVLGLRGLTKTVSWSNNPNGRFGDDRFGHGCQEKLMNYAKLASEQRNQKIPWLTAWWMDLVPAHKDDSPYFVDVGHGTWMNPFSVDLRTGIEGTPATRFVGADNFRNFQDLRKQVGLEWEREWDEAQTPDDQNGYENGDVLEDDEIPF
jgi:hypothetical protein